MDVRTTRMAWGPSPPAVTAYNLTSFLLVALFPLRRMLRKDKEEAEAIKHAKALEEEKAMYSVRAGPEWQGRCVLRGRHSLTSLIPTLLQGRRSRRQRREFREKRLRGRKISPPR